MWCTCMSCEREGGNEHLQAKAGAATGAGAALGRCWAGYEEVGPCPASEAYGLEKLPEGSQGLVRGRQAGRQRLRQ